MFADTAGNDFRHAGGYLVLGAALAATLQVVVPRSVLDTVAGSGLLAALALPERHSPPARDTWVEGVVRHGGTRAQPERPPGSW